MSMRGSGLAQQLEPDIDAETDCLRARGGRRAAVARRVAFRRWIRRGVVDEELRLQAEARERVEIFRPGEQLHLHAGIDGNLQSLTAFHRERLRLAVKEEGAVDLGGERPHGLPLADGDLRVARTVAIGDLQREIVARAYRRLRRDRVRLVLVNEAALQSEGVEHARARWICRDGQALRLAVKPAILASPLHRALPARLAADKM